MAAAEEAKRSKDQWRARREARREKQRAENVHRAAKMHAARLAFKASQRGSAARSADASDKPQSTRPVTAGQLNVGCSGWYYWHWRGGFYPADLPGSQWFPHYASHFRTVELNAPFYSWPTVATVNTWLRQIGRKRFTYTVKVNELITHTRRFVGTKALVRDFGHIADLLGPRFGCFLFQLPPSFHYTPAALKRILSQLDPRRRNVVEFRHRSWWNDAVYGAFREANAVFCSCSGPRLPDELVNTADDVYVRFHGTKQWYRHDYTRAELTTWAQRIRSCAAKRVWVYFNNDREGYAIKNARELLRLLKAR